MMKVFLLSISKHKTDWLSGYTYSLPEHRVGTQYHSLICDLTSDKTVWKKKKKHTQNTELILWLGTIIIPSVVICAPSVLTLYIHRQVFTEKVKKSGCCNLHYQHIKILRCTSFHVSWERQVCCAGLLDTLISYAQNLPKHGINCTLCAYKCILSSLCSKTWPQFICFWPLQGSVYFGISNSTRSHPRERYFHKISIVFP